MAQERAAYFVVVARGETEVWRSVERSLRAWETDRIELRWDRRMAERRRADAIAPQERRHGERRCLVDLDRFGFIVASRQDGRCQPCTTVTAGLWVGT
jgi:hypothetical protein